MLPLNVPWPLMYTKFQAGHSISFTPFFLPVPHWEPLSPQFLGQSPGGLSSSPPPAPSSPTRACQSQSPAPPQSPGSQSQPQLWHPAPQPLGPSVHPPQGPRGVCLAPRSEPVPPLALSPRRLLVTLGESSQPGLHPGAGPRTPEPGPTHRRGAAGLDARVSTAPGPAGSALPPGSPGLQPLDLAGARVRLPAPRRFRADLPGPRRSGRSRRLLGVPAARASPGSHLVGPGRPPSARIGTVCAGAASSVGL